MFSFSDQLTGNRALSQCEADEKATGYGLQAQPGLRGPLRGL
jgi:hypothetical protein